MAARNWPSLRDRFFSKIKVLENGCWEWHGSYFRKEYGDRAQFWKDGKPRIAARVSWELLRGPIKEGKMICHARACVLKERCVNPEHLYPGDDASNMADREAEGRTSRWDHRYNFRQTPILEAQVRFLRANGKRIEEICELLNIGRTTY